MGARGWAMGWTWWALGNRPAVFPVVGMIVGVLLASETEFPLELFLFILVGAVAAASWRGARVGGRTLVLVSGLGLGGVLAGLQALTEGPELVPGARAVLEGEIEASRAVEGGSQFTLQVSRVDGLRARFRAQLFGVGAQPVLPGARVRVEAKLKPLAATANPGEWSTWRRSASRGQLHSGSFEAGRLVRLSEAPGWRQWLAGTHAALEERTRQLAPDEASASLFLTLSAGLRATLDERIEEDFARSGLAHVLSVSGLHVAVLAFALFALLRWLAIRAPLRLFRRVEPRRVAAPLSLPLTWGYVLFTGLQAPAVRSAVMCSIVLLAHSLRRRSDGLNALAVAAAVMVAIDPSSIFDLSLQLSFSAVLSLVLLTGTLRALVPLPVPSPARAQGFRLRLWRWHEAALTTLLASLAVTVVSAPLVAMSFQRLGVAGLFSNVVAMPISGGLTLLAATGAAGFVIAPSLATPVIWVGTRLASLMLALAEWFAALPFASWDVPAPSLALAIGWWAGVAVFVFARGWRRWFALLTPVAAALHLVLLLPSDGLEVTFLAVGHGDATVVSHRGVHVLIDGGGVPKGTDTGQRFVLPYLRQKQVRALDLAVLTHAHPDHGLGLISTLEAVPTKRLWLSPSPPGPLTNDLIAAADQAEVELIERGREAWQFGDARLEVLGPPVDRSAIEHENDRSIVLRLVHREVSFLFTGDVEALGEASLGALEPATVVKAPHHGSDTSSTPDFVAQTRPRYVVFCVGSNNRFGFPRRPVVERWEAGGARCFRTDRDGAITFRSDGRRVTVETFAPRQLGQARRLRWR